jgi:hypothetical protein
VHIPDPGLEDDDDDDDSEKPDDKGDQHGKGNGT